MVSDSLIQPRRKGTSIWKQIEETLLGEIIRGTLVPGERLPSEGALADRFSVNRHTVRRALSELCARDLVQVENGRGAFVTDKVLRYKLDKRTRSLESMLLGGHDMIVKVLKTSQKAAGAKVASALSLQEGASVWVVDSLSTIDKLPAICAQHSFPADRFPDFLARYKVEKSISATLKTYGVVSTRKSMVISAMLADPGDLKLLNLEGPAAVIAVENIYVDAEGIPVDHGVSRFAGDRIDLKIE